MYRSVPARSPNVPLCPPRSFSAVAPAGSHIGLELLWQLGNEVQLGIRGSLFQVLGPCLACFGTSRVLQTLCPALSTLQVGCDSLSSSLALLHPCMMLARTLVAKSTGSCTSHDLKRNDFKTPKKASTDSDPQAIQVFGYVHQWRLTNIADLVPVGLDV